MQQTESYFPFKSFIAEMKSYILLNTATIFFKQGISSEYTGFESHCRQECFIL